MPECNHTTVTTSTVGPPLPAGLRLVGDYYDINTTATFSDPVTVCITYDEAEVAGAESNLVLLHEQTDGDGLIEIGVPIIEKANDTICGETLTFSIFAVAEPAPPVGGIVELVTGPHDSPADLQDGRSHERELAALVLALGAVGVSWHRYRRRAG